MQRYFLRLRNFLYLLKFMQWKEILSKIRNRLYSDTFYYGLVNGFPEACTTVPSAIPVRLRPLQDTDIAVLFDVHTPHLTDIGIAERLYRLLLINSKIRSCYVAVTQDGNPCSALWLIPATENKKLRDHSNKSFPLLADDEMLLEGLFTLETFRNKHIMACCVGQVLETAKASGAKKVLSFVHNENIQSLRLLKRTGFGEYTIKREKWCFFFRTVTFEPMPGCNIPAEVLHTLVL